MQVKHENSSQQTDILPKSALVIGLDGHVCMYEAPNRYDCIIMMLVSKLNKFTWNILLEQFVYNWKHYVSARNESDSASVAGIQ
jgi:hypothetical protein